MIKLNPIWKKPPLELKLLGNELHLWIAQIDLPYENVLGMVDYLSSDEVLRAKSYAFSKDRERFIICRGILRTLLGKYLNADPRSLKFSYTYYGKPSVCNSHINFNISHSGQLCLYAFSSRNQIGIDIEQIRYDFDEFDLAEKFFSQKETFLLKMQPTQLRKKAFFNVWTRKEAFIKAVGEGLSIGLDSFSVPVEPYYSEEFLCIDSSLRNTSWKSYILKILSSGENYSSAVVMMEMPEEIKYWKWDLMTKEEQEVVKKIIP